MPLNLLLSFTKLRFKWCMLFLHLPHLNRKRKVPNFRNIGLFVQLFFCFFSLQLSVQFVTHFQCMNAALIGNEAVLSYKRFLSLCRLPFGGENCVSSVFNIFYFKFYQKNSVSLYLNTNKGIFKCAQKFASLERQNLSNDLPINMSSSSNETVSKQRA